MLRWKRGSTCRLFGKETAAARALAQAAARRTPSSLELLREQRAALRRRLLEHGGLLFRGFPIENAQDFSAAIEALGTGSSVNYIGGDSPRTKITGAVYTSTEAPPR